MAGAARHDWVLSVGTDAGGPAVPGQDPPDGRPEADLPARGGKAFVTTDSGQTFSEALVGGVTAAPPVPADGAPPDTVTNGSLVVMLPG